MLSSLNHRKSYYLMITLIVVLALSHSLSANAGQSNNETKLETRLETVVIPAGSFIFGSDREEREFAYQLDEKAYGHSVTRDSKWYETEAERQSISLKQFEITKTAITNRQYSEFVKATNHPSPTVEKELWESYGLIHPFERTKRHQWVGNNPPKDRDDHPVVLVSYTDAIAYADWLTKTTPYKWRLPTEKEWVKAARGPAGWRFPWGNDFDAKLLNSHDSGPYDTVKVGTLSQANSYGLLDSAGQVFEWMLTAPDAKRALVKGGSWDDKGCGVCRPAAKHNRPIFLKHILIGFRLIKE